MSSCPKRVTCAEAQISQLPDDILCHILLLLPSEEAARTCVVSRRWRYLFLRVPKLIAMGHSDSFDRDPELNREMNNFVNRWIMSSEEVSVNEFRYKTTNFPEESVFYLWLTTLLSRGIKVLHLRSEGFYIRPPKLMYPPEGFFRSESLVDLKIDGNAFILEIPDVICYSSLKTLCLKDLHVVDESGQFGFVHASYPRLEELSLDSVNFILAGEAHEGLRFEGVEMKLTISLTTLKKLVLNSDFGMMGRVDIDTQHLEHLEFTVATHSDKQVVNFIRSESLAYAHIYRFGRGESFFKFLSQINNVKTIRFSDRDRDYEDYDDFAGSSPLFIHLTRLELWQAAHQSVWILLHLAPNLEVIDYALSFKYEDYWPPEDVPLCLSQSVKVIRIRDYKWYEDVMEADEIGEVDEVGSHAEIVEYLLQHGAMLGRMSIGHSKHKTAEWRQSTLNLYRNFDCLSQNCEIDLQER